MEFKNYTSRGIRTAFINYENDIIIGTMANFIFISQNGKLLKRFVMHEDIVYFEHIPLTAILELVKARGLHILKEIPFEAITQDCMEQLDRLCQKHVYCKEQMLYNLTKKYPAMRRLVKEVDLIHLN